MGMTKEVLSKMKSKRITYIYNQKETFVMFETNNEKRGLVEFDSNTVR